MKLRKRIAAIGAAVMMATSTISANAAWKTKAKASQSFSECRTSSTFYNTEEGGHYTDFRKLKVIRYEGQRVGDLYGKLNYHFFWFLTDTVEAKTANCAHDHYSWVKTGEEYQEGDCMQGSYQSLSGEADLTKGRGNGNATFGGVVRIP